MQAACRLQSVVTADGSVTATLVPLCFVMCKYVTLFGSLNIRSRDACGSIALVVSDSRASCLILHLYSSPLVVTLSECRKAVRFIANPNDAHIGSERIPIPRYVQPF